jgi:dTDP-4-amino-4,6-dideoxygalactose transaminase
MNFANLDRQAAMYFRELNAAVADVCSHAKFILGPEVEHFESLMAERCKRKHAIGCASGTDALTMALMVARSWKKTGGTVLTSPFCFVATAEAAALLGMEVLFSDIEVETFSLDPEYVWAEVNRQAPWWRPTDGRLRTLDAVVIPNMFGRMAQWERFEKLQARGIILIEDAAQSFGASRGGRPSGCFGDMSILSFFPTKPLGCYGDGGMVLTDSDEYADMLRSIRSHGCGNSKYDHRMVGMNSRLDTIQAAVLLTKIEWVEKERSRRIMTAQHYCSEFDGLDWLYVPEHGEDSAVAQFSLLLPNKRIRYAFQEYMKSQGIPTMVHYPKPLNLQVPYLDGKVYEQAQETCGRIVQIPCDAYMTDEEVLQVVTAVKMFDSAPMFGLTSEG